MPPRITNKRRGVNKKGGKHIKNLIYKSYNSFSISVAMSLINALGPKLTKP
jgi:hypothetical protein